MQINGIVFLVRVGFHELQFEMTEIGVKSLEEREFSCGFPKVVKHLCLWVKVSDAAKYVVVSLHYFGVIAAGVQLKQEFDHIFFDLIVQSEKTVPCHGCGDADIVGCSCVSMGFVGHCRWGKVKAAIIEGSTRATGTILYRLADRHRGLQISMI